MLLRRDFIKGCAAAALANPLFASLRADAMTIVAIVDAHCHIFNGDDLPIVQFIEKVALPKQSEFKQYVTEYGHVIRFIIRYLAKWILILVASIAWVVWTERKSKQSLDEGALDQV
jgi:hypothetical protein